jgi:UDP-hydrolysing UDP-N-acetyl-D-glucosamine 2-epimerase
MSASRKICVVTGSRAEYGHLFWLMRSIKEDRSLKLQLVVTGMHLEKNFGSTFQVILKDGFHIDRKVKVLTGNNSPLGIAQSVGQGCTQMAKAFSELKPDLILLCGDRFEIFAAASAAHILGIPIAHLHGGETSEGAIDEAMRHAITKMSYLHFTATDAYRRRVIQLGEDPKRVYNFGAPGLDHLAHQTFLDREELGSVIKFEIKSPCAIVTFHPVTLDKESPLKELNEVLAAIKSSSINAIFTKSNADAGGALINERLKEFCAQNKTRFVLCDNLGSHLYLSCLNALDLMIGNSSSGIVEAASFKLPVVNIGDRQKGRLKAANVIHAEPLARTISAAIREALSTGFKSNIKNLKNPYAPTKTGQISERIKDVLKRIKLDDNCLKKQFYDLKGIK